MHEGIVHQPRTSPSVKMTSLRFGNAKLAELPMETIILPSRCSGVNFFLLLTLTSVLQCPHVGNGCKTFNGSGSSGSTRTRLISTTSAASHAIGNSMPRVLEPPPFTRVEPVTEVLHGVEITDPYRWLEDQNSPRTRKWIDEQTAYTRAYLDAIPGRDRIRKRVEELLAVEVVSEPRKAGNRYFFMKRKPDREQAIIAMREGIGEEEVVLLDPAGRGEGDSTALDIVGSSPSGEYLAYAVRHEGTDSAILEILDVQRRAQLPDRLPSEDCGAPIFSPDGRGFHYIRPPKVTLPQGSKTVYWHTFGTNADADVEVFSVGDDAKRLVSWGTLDGRYLAHYVTLSDDPAITDLYVQDLFSGSPAKLIINRIEGVFWPVFAGEGLVTLTEWEAANYRVVFIDLTDPSRDTWRELVPQSDARIHEFAVVGELILLKYVRETSTQIEVFDLHGHKRDTFPSPQWSTTNFLAWEPSSDVLFYRVSSYSSPPEIRCYHTRTGQHEVLACRRPPVNPSAIAVEPVRYGSKDGTEIPMLLVSRKGRHSGPAPTILTGYGGFGASLTPQFSAFVTFLIEHGCVFASASLRGGAEYGERWHRAGRRRNRQNAIDDFIAAAEWLLEKERASAGQLAIVGGSNAGLLVGAAVTQRPELFNAVLCLGPLLDMLRYHHFDEADRWTEEYGSAEDASDFQALRAYSPYGRVQDRTAYPATMIVSGDADTRCNPMHARKMAARLQSASASGRPVLLDYNQRRGHMPVQPLTKRIEALTDRLAFLCYELGISF